MQLICLDEAGNTGRKADPDQPVHMIGALVVGQEQILRPHMLCFQFILERVQDYLFVPGDLGLIVADEHRELGDEIIRDLTRSKQDSTGWGWRPTPITRVVDTVHFVKSRHNRLVQACDVLTYFRLKAYRYRSKLLESFHTERPSA